MDERGKHRRRWIDGLFLDKADPAFSAPAGGWSAGLHGDAARDHLPVHPGSRARSAAGERELLRVATRYRVAPSAQRSDFGASAVRAAVVVVHADECPGRTGKRLPYARADGEPA